MTLEAHFKAALDSVKAQQKAEPDQPYEMTAALQGSLRPHGSP